jgi:hypothetical protein
MLLVFACGHKSVLENNGAVMKNLNKSTWQTQKRKIALVCAFTFGFTLAATDTHAQQQQQPQQSTQQVQPDPAQLELVKKFGLSRNMKGPPAFAIPAGVHFAPAAPTNFPVEIYSSNVTSTNFLNSTKGAAAAGLSIITKDSPTVVFQFYQAALRRGGWVAQIPSPEALAKMGKPGQFYMLRGTKQKQMVNITLQAKGGEAGTYISINWYIVP